VGARNCANRIHKKGSNLQTSDPHPPPLRPCENILYKLTYTVQTIA
jgi:hypothetical protein